MGGKRRVMPATNRRLYATVAVVLLVLLAGCAGVMTPMTEDQEIAPGVTSDRVTDAAALAEVHRALLTNTSYMYVRNYTQHIDAPGYRYTAEHDERAWVGANGTFLYHHRGVVSGDERSSAYVDGVWANDSVAVMRTVEIENATVRYTRYRPPEPFTARNVTSINLAGELASAQVMATWNDSGRAYAQVQANRSESHRWQPANGSAVNLTTRQTAMATIREDGFVPGLTTMTTGERPLPDARNASATASAPPIAHVRDDARLRYHDLGETTVPRPAWVEDALTATEGMALGIQSTRRPANVSAERVD